MLQRNSIQCNSLPTKAMLLHFIRYRKMYTVVQERKVGLTYSFTKFKTLKTRTMPAENNEYYFPGLHFSV